ncbi:MAG: HNH endonuclease [Planctomycetia bacterium]|nr:HNH endonuclease [Planctomycetia bacterium]
MSQSEWLGKLAQLKVYRAKHGDAPHKPLLLLVLLEMAERGELLSPHVELSPELAFQFSTLWPIVSHRRTQRPDVRMPFHHLGSDGFWQAFMRNGQSSPDKKLTSHILLNADFHALLDDPCFRENARRILIAKWFQPAERTALYALYGIPIPSDDEVARDARFELPDDAERTGREARFRLDVVPAYDYTCALTGYRVTTIDAGTIVDAAHIHAFKDSRNNDPRNGIALCKNAHWLFDAGLWSLDDDYCVVVATEALVESSPEQKPLSDMHGQRLRLPPNVAIWPSKVHLAWHRANRFKRFV